MGDAVTLNEFLARCDEHHISYRLDRVRDAVMAVVAIPGERWEVEFMDDEGIEVEKFRSDGTIFDGTALDELWAG
jgi:hypothetical protein